MVLLVTEDYFFHLSAYLLYFRVIKETLRASGANVTKNYIIQVSLAALFLLEACKKVSMHFGIHQTSHHTARDSTSDVHKMCMHLLQENATKESKERAGSTFVEEWRR